MSWLLDPRGDVGEHNAAVARVWEAYRAGQPCRVPVSVTGSIRNLIQNPALNTTGWTFEDYFTNPQAQIDCQLAYQRWQRYHVLCDHEMGPPEGGWQVAIDFQNSYDAAWFGCPLRYDGNHMPDTVEILREDKHKLYEMTCPDPLRGHLAGRAMAFFEFMHERCPHMTFEDLPVLPPRTIPGEGCMNLVGIAQKLRGTAELCIDMLTDPDYYHDLMTFVTESLIRRMKSVRQWRWGRDPDAPDKGRFRQANYGFGDDGIQLLSLAQYKEFVLPYDQRRVDAFSDGGPTSVHMCGDHARFFPFFRDHFRVRSFDTGFPIDHAALRRELGPEVEIRGGPSVVLVQQGPPEAIRDEVRRICTGGVMDGGRFVMIAANNLAPLTPVEHIAALYDATKEFGRYAGPGA